MVSVPAGTILSSTSKWPARQRDGVQLKVRQAPIQLLSLSERMKSTPPPPPPIFFSLSYPPPSMSPTLPSPHSVLPLNRHADNRQRVRGSDGFLKTVNNYLSAIFFLRWGTPWGHSECLCVCVFLVFTELRNHTAHD